MTILDDHLGECTVCTFAPPLPYDAPPSAFSTPRFYFLAWPTWVQEAVAGYVLGSARRLKSLGHVVYHAADDYERAIIVQEEKRLTGMWLSATAQAPLDKLVINPAACRTIIFRVHCLRTGLGNTSSRYAPLLLFGLRALKPGVVAVQHGYWWVRTCMRSGAFEAFESWTCVNPEPVWPTAAAVNSPASGESSPSEDAATNAPVAVESRSIDDVAPSAPAVAGSSSTADAAANAPAADRSGSIDNAAANVPPALGSRITHDAIAPLRKLWRESSDYSQPLRDDWGEADRRIPPVWRNFVVERGGLASTAAFDLQAWMVVADLGIDNLSDLYLSLGQPSQLGGRHMLVGGSSQSVPESPGGGDSEFATADAFVDVLERLPSLSVTIARLLPGPGVSALRASTTDVDTASRWQAAVACLNRCVKHPDKAHTAGLMASLLLSQTQAEGARFRDVLRLDTATETLLPTGAAPLEAATALAAVILTGFAITFQDGGGDGTPARASNSPKQGQSSDGDGDRPTSSVVLTLDTLQTPPT